MWILIFPLIPFPSFLLSPSYIKKNWQRRESNHVIQYRLLHRHLFVHLAHSHIQGLIHQASLARFVLQVTSWRCDCFCYLFMIVSWLITTFLATGIHVLEPGEVASLLVPASCFLRWWLLRVINGEVWIMWPIRLRWIEGGTVGGWVDGRFIRCTLCKCR